MGTALVRRRSGSLLVLWFRLVNAGGRRIRLPPQGGLPPVDTVTGAVVEIASDESGFSGTNLLHPATPVITHASVDLCTGEAVELITALRSRFRFSPNEFKSGQFLR
jgi:hypothetical protein